MRALAPVIPLKAAYEVARSPEPPEATEPAQLYDRIVFTLVLHGHGDLVVRLDGTPDFGGCVQCGDPWPCTQVRLAFRLREGFY
jgi:hypothetical protein